MITYEGIPGQSSTNEVTRLLRKIKDLETKIHGLSQKFKDRSSMPGDWPELERLRKMLTATRALCSAIEGVDRG